MNICYSLRNESNSYIFAVLLVSIIWEEWSGKTEIDNASFRF